MRWRARKARFTPPVGRSASGLVLMLPIPAALLLAAIAVTGTWWHRDDALGGQQALLDARRVVLGLVALVLLLAAIITWLMRSFDARGRELVRSRDELGKRVRDRTRQLVHANICLQREVGERRRIEGEADAARRSRESASRARREFLVEAGMEMRQKLRALLDESKRDPACATHVESCSCDVEFLRDSGSVLMRILDDFLDVSLIESGRPGVERTAVSPEDLTLDVLELLAGHARERRTQLHAEFRGKLPATILTSPGRVIHVLASLVRVAVDRSEAGRVVVSCDETIDRDPSIASEASESASKSGQQGVPHSPRLRWTVTSLPADAPVTASGSRQSDPEERAPSSRKSGGAGLMRALSVSIAELLGGHLREHEHDGVVRSCSLLIDPGPLEGIPRLRPRAERASGPARLKPEQGDPSAGVEDRNSGERDTADNRVTDRGGDMEPVGIRWTE